MTLGYNSKLLKRCAEVIILSAPLFIMYPSFVIFRELIAVFADSDSISRGISLCEVFISVLYAFVFSFLVDNSWSNAIKDNRKLMPRSRYVPYWKRRNYMSGYEKRIKHVFSLFTISYMLTISITIIWYVCYANNDGTRLAILFSSIVACLFLFSLPLQYNKCSLCNNSIELCIPNPLNKMLSIYISQLSAFIFPLLKMSTEL